jgi:GTP-binding protein
MKNKPIVAIVGRPNVGKSTLFNRFSRKRSAIIDFEEGITRDRKYELVEWNAREFMIVDTGGIIPDSTEVIDKAIIVQAKIAIEQADVVIFMCDVKTGIAKFDSQIANVLSAIREKVLLVVNKVDSDKDELDLYDFMKLGYGVPIGIAASSGRNIGDFLDVLVSKLPHIDQEHFIEDTLTNDDNHIKVAIIGKPNVGKSSIINRLVGEEAVIVTDIPGTTRDSIDLEIIYNEHKITLVDTAGLRKKGKIKYGVEYFSSMRTIESIDKADIILLVLDSFDSFSDQDQKIASYAQRHYKNIIIILNKWDLIEDKDNKTFNNYIKQVREDFPFLDYCPILTMSALTGQRVNKIPETLLSVWDEANTRIGTGELNRFFEKIIMRQPPSHSSGKHIKIYYVTQQNINPPTFIFFTNEPKLIPVHYKRFLKNKIREEFKFTGATIKLIFKGRDDHATMVEY